MKKVLGIFVLVLTALVLISCGGGGGGGGGGGTVAPAAAATSNTYTGSFAVNGTNYSSLTIGNGKYTLAGTNGTDTGTYQSEAAMSALSSTRAGITIEDGTFVLTSTTHHGTWKMTIGGNGGNSISFHNGSLSASGTGTVVSQGGSLIGRWFLPDPDPVLADGGVELEFKNNSQLVARVTLEGYDNQGRWRQFPGSVTFPYTATENTITLTNTVLDFDIGGLTDEEEILLMLAIMFFGDDMDVDAGDGSTDTIYYAVKGNLLITASDAALTEEVDVATRR